MPEAELFLPMMYFDPSQLLLIYLSLLISLGAFKMEGWGQAMEKEDGIKYEHDEITCKKAVK